MLFMLRSTSKSSRRKRRKWKWKKKPPNGSPNQASSSWLEKKTEWFDPNIWAKDCSNTDNTVDYKDGKTGGRHRTNSNLLCLRWLLKLIAPHPQHTQMIAYSLCSHLYAIPYLKDKFGLSNSSTAPFSLCPAVRTHSMRKFYFITCM